MKLSILLLALSAVTISITSCTSAYKSGQTPDDVYFSPQRPQAEYVSSRDKEEDPGYYNGEDYYGDRYLQMKVKNRYQWSELDDYYYNDRFSYGFGGYGGYSYYNSLYWNNPWNPSSYWNYYYNPYYTSFYNPYYSPAIIVGSKYPNYYNNNSYTVTNRPRMFNLNTYNNNMLNNSNYTNRRFDYNNNYQNNTNSTRYNSNYRNSRSSAGDYLRNSFNSNDNYSRSNNSSNFNNSNSGGSRSSGSSSGGGSSSSSSGSSAPVRRF
ncbi:MAG: hypothetical protein JSS70_16870 [Bacteroidetes bacterium]|nr:hypothetical protein [Bacteroidota bacterium]